MSGDLFKPQLRVSPVELLVHFVVISPVSKCIIGTDILRIGRVDSLTFRVRAITV